MNKALKIVLPLVILVLGVVAAQIMIASKPDPQTRSVEAAAPLVRVLPVQLEDRHLSVTTQGTVSPSTESTLVPEVAGRVIWVAPFFASGGFFEADEPLLRIDPHDHRQAAIQARAAVAQAELRLAQEQAEGEIARREWGELDGGEASPLTRREPQLAEARASLEAAVAAAEQAERNLERTEIRSPYAGRIREKLVDRGQYVTPGARLATIYAVDYAEVRLPLRNSDLAFIDLPMGYRGEPRNAAGPQVVLRAEFAGRTHEWNGRIVRTEGEIDPTSRLVHAVAQVKNPYGRGKAPDRPPLAAGMFVEAEISGKLVENLAVIPRAALRGENQVLIVDDERRLRFRSIELLRATEDSLYVRAGLQQGERICVSPLAAVTDGMRVRLVDPVEDES